jgi:hypothetical protein
MSEFLAELTVKLGRRGNAFTEKPGESSDEAALISNDSRIVQLERSLNRSDARLKETQAALLAQGRRSGSQTLDDQTVHDRFATLNRRINEWVLTHLKHGRPAHVMTYLKNTHPEYKQLLNNNQTRYLLLRAIVGDLLAEAFKTGDIIGHEHFVRMSSYLSKTGKSQIQG